MIQHEITLSPYTSLTTHVLLPGVRLALTREDRERVYRFRYQVYVEQQRKQVSAADPATRMLTDEMDEWGHVLYVERDGNIAATLCTNLGCDQPIPARYAAPLDVSRFAPEFGPRECSITLRMIVADRWRTPRVLLPILRSAYRVGRAGNLALNFIYCAPHLVPFFRHLGFRCYQPGFIDPEVGFRVPMVMSLKDAEHMRISRSPFLPDALEFGGAAPMDAWLRRRFPDADTVHSEVLEAS